MNPPEGTLQRAACYRFLSRLVQRPCASSAEALASLAPLLPGELAAEALALAKRVCADLETEYHRCLGAGGACAECESDYEPAALGGKGPLLADVAGFYQAFHFAPEAEIHQSPDHISAQLSFLGFLALKEAYGTHAGTGDNAALCREASEKFLDAHLRRWAPEFLERLEAVAHPGFYGDAARFAPRLLAAIGLYW